MRPQDGTVVVQLVVVDSGVTLVKKDIMEDLGLAYPAGSACVMVILVNVIVHQEGVLTVLIIPGGKIVIYVIMDMLEML